MRRKGKAAADTRQMAAIMDRAAGRRPAAGVIRAGREAMTAKRS